MNPTKFGSLNLDTPSSRYEFLKSEFISEKNKEKHLKLKSLRAPSAMHQEALAPRPRGQRDPMRHTHRIGVQLDWRRTCRW